MKKRASKPGLTLPGWDGQYELVRQSSGRGVQPGQVLRRGAVLGGGTPPRNAASSGRLHTVNGTSFYPEVMGLKWRKLPGRFAVGETGFQQALNRLRSSGALSEAALDFAQRLHNARLARTASQAIRIQAPRHYGKTAGRSKGVPI